jgi:hypothetical protein
LDVLRREIFGTSEFSERRGWEIAGEYVDAEISGAKEKATYTRPAYGRRGQAALRRFRESLDTATLAGWMVFTRARDTHLASGSMKENIPEQIVEEYLKFSGFFTVHRARAHSD